MLTSLVERIVRKVSCPTHPPSSPTLSLSLWQCVVWEVPNVHRGFLSHDESCDQWVLKTDGVNLQVSHTHVLTYSGINILYVVQELWRHADCVELNKVYTNSIHSMASTYGIEAAATTIVRVSSSCLWP